MAGFAGRKFLLGQGPKPVVQKVEGYFKAQTSVAEALIDLLNNFDPKSFQNYFTSLVTDDDDLVEISKCILIGKHRDGELNIKSAFTQLSLTLKKYEITKRFGVGMHITFFIKAVFSWAQHLCAHIGYLRYPKISLACDRY